MPLFRTRPSSNLTTSIRRLIASGGSRLNPLHEMEADLAAARTARETSLAEKVRAEVDAMKGAEAARNDPAVAAEFASHTAGLDVPTGTRLSNHLRGVLEQPSGADYEDNPNVQPYTAGAPNVDDGKRRLFQSALASTIANRLATGKTNAKQLAKSGGTINETALTQQAALEQDTPTANRIIAAVAGKLRNPFKVGPQGQVLNQESGAVNEGTDVTRSEVGVNKARSGELGTRSGLNVARTGTEAYRATELAARARLANERRDAVARGADRGGARVTPQQVERWVSEVARKEWDTIPARERKGMNYNQHLEKVRERFKATATGGGAADEVKDAHAAIAKGADKAKVAKRFKERMGFALPEPEKALPDEDEE